jgi:hypothetical protein
MSQVLKEFIWHNFLQETGPQGLLSHIIRNFRCLIILKKVQDLLQCKFTLMKFFSSRNRTFCTVFQLNKLKLRSRSATLSIEKSGAVPYRDLVTILTPLTFTRETE